MSHEEVILVTGSSGLIGNAVAARLASSYKVVGFDRTPPSRAHSHVYPVPVDLTSEEDLSRAFKTLLDTHGNRLMSVIHLAAYFDFSGEPNKLYDTLTVEGTRRLLQRLAPLSVEQFIFSSTMLVHAPCLPGQFLTEESPLDPRWDYPISKVRPNRLFIPNEGPSLLSPCALEAFTQIAATASPSPIKYSAFMNAGSPAVSSLVLFLTVKRLFIWMIWLMHSLLPSSAVNRCLQNVRS